VNVALDEAELRQRQHYYDRHQHDRLNRRSAEIERFRTLLAALQSIPRSLIERRPIDAPGRPGRFRTSSCR